jgi:hypothetical protein
MGASDHTDQPIIVVDQETRRSGARRVDKVKLEQRGRCCGLNGGPVDVRFGNERIGRINSVFRTTAKYSSDN